MFAHTAQTSYWWPGLITLILGPDAEISINIHSHRAGEREGTSELVCARQAYVRKCYHFIRNRVYNRHIG